MSIITLTVVLITMKRLNSTVVEKAILDIVIDEEGISAYDNTTFKHEQLTKDVFYLDMDIAKLKLNTMVEIVKRITDRLWYISHLYEHQNGQSHNLRVVYKTLIDGTD